MGSNHELWVPEISELQIRIVGAGEVPDQLQPNRQQKSEKRAISGQRKNVVVVTHGF